MYLNIQYINAFINILHIKLLMRKRQDFICFIVIESID